MDSLTGLVHFMEANPVLVITAAAVAGCAVMLWWRRRATGLRIASFERMKRAQGPTERFWTATQNSHHGLHRGAARGKSIGSAIGSQIGYVLDLLIRGAYALTNHAMDERVSSPQPLFERLLGFLGGILGSLIGGTCGATTGAGHGAITGQSRPNPPYL